MLRRFQLVFVFAALLSAGGCGASNSIGNPDLSPSIATQPQSQTISSGQTATMTVAATGTAPLSYQWYQGSTGDKTNPINAAASSSYTTPALTTTTNYWMQVSNAVGTANSSTATVTVTALFALT